MDEWPTTKVYTPCLLPLGMTQFSICNMKDIDSKMDFPKMDFVHPTNNHNTGLCISTSVLP